MLEAFYYVGCMMQNILAIKTINLGFLIIDTGSFISPFTFAFGDIACELYGRKKTTKIFTNACVINFVFSVGMMAVSKIQGVDGYIDDCYSTILGNNLRFVLASAIAFYVGNISNAYIMTGAKGAYGKRAIVSTIIGQFFDNAIFFIIAYAPLGINVWEMGWKDIFVMVLTGTIWEVIIEATTVPLSKNYIERVKKNNG